VTEDEGFIRAIVDGPGDDTPRLVYADWLDDRADPRGQYLRAERESIVTGDVERLRELAAGLDPVWVARVSLPPVGVCIEYALLTDRGPPITGSDIDSVDRRLGVTLPAAYRAFLLNYNGCVLQRLWGEIDGEIITDDNPLTLLSLGPAPPGRKGLEEWTARHRRLLTNPTSYLEGQLDPATAAAHHDLVPIGWFESCHVYLWVRGPRTGAACYGDILGADLPDHETLLDTTAGQSLADFLAWFLRLPTFGEAPP
jgi:uncharacterized protein (TIGR02996 family)